MAQAEARSEVMFHQRHLEHLRELEVLRETMDDLARALEANVQSAKLKEHSLNELIAKKHRALDVAKLQKQELADRLTSRIDDLQSTLDELGQKVATAEDSKLAMAQANARSEAEFHQRHLEHLRELEVLRETMDDLARALEANLQSAKLKEHSLNELIAKKQRALDIAKVQKQEITDQLNSRIFELGQRIATAEESNRALSRRVSNIHHDLMNVAVGVNSIQESKIWKALVWVGGVLLRITGSPNRK